MQAQLSGSPKLSAPTNSQVASTSFILAVYPTVIHRFSLINTYLWNLKRRSGLTIREEDFKEDVCTKNIFFVLKSDLKSVQNKRKSTKIINNLLLFLRSPVVFNEYR